MAFADQLKKLRAESGLTQEVLASAAGLTRGAVARLELGTRMPSWETVQALAEALGVDCTAFKDEEKPKAKTSPKKNRKAPK